MVVDAQVANDFEPPCDVQKKVQAFKNLFNAWIFAAFTAKEVLDSTYNVVVLTLVDQFAEQGSSVSGAVLRFSKRQTDIYSFSPETNDQVYFIYNFSCKLCFWSLIGQLLSPVIFIASYIIWLYSQHNNDIFKIQSVHVQQQSTVKIIIDTYKNQL